MFDYRRVPDDSIDARWCRPRLRESTCCPGNWRNVRSLDKGRGNQSGMWPTCGLLSKKMIRANVIEKDESSKCKDNIGELMHIIFKVYSWLMLIVNTMRCEMVPKKILWASRQIRMEIITRICGQKIYKLKKTSLSVGEQRQKSHDLGYRLGSHIEYSNVGRAFLAKLIKGLALVFEQLAYIAMDLRMGGVRTLRERGRDTSRKPLSIVIYFHFHVPSAKLT